MCGILLIAEGIHVVPQAVGLKLGHQLQQQVDVGSTFKVPMLEDFVPGLTARGPDSIGCTEVLAVGDARITLSASLLQLRGSLPGSSPLRHGCTAPAAGQQHDNADVVAFNGEIFGGLSVSSGQNDGAVLWDALATAPDGAAIVALLSGLRGPWAVLHWRPSSNTLWFGRDFMGRRSLLLHLPDARDPRLILTSVAPPDAAHAPSAHAATACDHMAQAATPCAADVDETGGAVPIAPSADGYWQELPPGIYSLQLHGVPADGRSSETAATASSQGRHGASSSGVSASESVHKSSATQFNDSACGRSSQGDCAGSGRITTMLSEHEWRDTVIQDLVDYQRSAALCGATDAPEDAFAGFEPKQAAAASLPAPCANADAASHVVGAGASVVEACQRVSRQEPHSDGNSISQSKPDSRSQSQSTEASTCSQAVQGPERSHSRDGWQEPSLSDVPPPLALKSAPAGSNNAAEGARPATNSSCRPGSSRNSPLLDTAAGHSSSSSEKPQRARAQGGSAHACSKHAAVGSATQQEVDKLAEEFLAAMTAAVEVRSRCIEQRSTVVSRLPPGNPSSTSSPAPTASCAVARASVVVLFSGGADSMLLAALLHRCLPQGQPIDLANVCFGGGTSADRLAARSGLEELASFAPARLWRLIEVDSSLDEMEAHRGHILSLLHPAGTFMDLNIGMALWKATSADGTLRLPRNSRSTAPVVEDGEAGQDGQPYRSAARVVFLGHGADEQCAGYGRHRTRFRNQGWCGLHEELRLDVRRMWLRNLGRDDRLVADWGREARHPFLDEAVMTLLLHAPLPLITNLTQPLGEGDKVVVRRALQLLGLPAAGGRVKRAIQFGSKIGRASNERYFGSNQAAQKVHAGKVAVTSRA